MEVHQRTALALSCQRHNPVVQMPSNADKSRFPRKWNIYTMVRRGEEPAAEERELPLLPLFPHVLLPAGMLTVTMSGSNPLIKHLAHASGPDTLVAAVPYDPSPEREDEAAAGHELVLDHDRLFHTGTAARVAHLLKDNKSGMWTLALEGLHRLGISNVTSAEPSGRGPWFVSASQLDHFVSRDGGNSTSDSSSGAEEAALAQRLVAQTRELTLRLQGRARGTEAARRIARVLLASGPERMTDTLGSLVARARTDRLLVLGTLDRLERMRLVSSQLERVLRALAKRAQQSASSSPDTSPNVSPGAITGLGAASKPQNLSPGNRSLSLPEDDEMEDVERVMARLVAARPPRSVLDAARREARRLSRTTEQSPGFAMGLAYLEVLADLPWDKWSWQQKESTSSVGLKKDGEANQKKQETTVESTSSSVTHTGPGVGLVKSGAKKIVINAEEGSTSEGIISNLQGDSLSTTDSTKPKPDTQQKPLLDPSLASVRAALDAEHTGLEDVKRRIVEYVAVRRLRGWDTRAPVLCLVGPPGVGKTSLAASVARALGRPLQRMALGGVRDEAELRGHRRTYVGAMPGRVIKALQRAKVRDPLILLDEVDKMGRDGHRGDPAAALLEILDPEQNAAFTDTYLAVPFDLSAILFIATANSASDIPAPLLDRMELVQLGGYTLDEKLGIARKHLVPKLLAEHGLTDRDVVFTDEPLRILVEGYTREAGVRNLSRSIAAICRHVVADVVVKGLDDDDDSGGGEHRLETTSQGSGDYRQEQQHGIDISSNRHAMSATSGPSHTALIAPSLSSSSAMVHATSMTPSMAPTPTPTSSSSTGDLDGVMVISEVPAAGGPDLASLAGCLARPSSGRRLHKTRRSTSEGAYHGGLSAGGVLAGWLSRRNRRSNSIQETSPSSSSCSHGHQIAPAESPTAAAHEAHTQSHYPPPGHDHRRKDAGVHVTAELIERVLKGRRYDKHDETHRVSAPGAAAGLVWTAAGGAVQYIECIATDKESKNGKLTLTGQLGDVLEESARIALSWVRSRYRQLVTMNEGDIKTWASATQRVEESIDDAITTEEKKKSSLGTTTTSPSSASTWDVHVHLPAGAVPKDGPSAGITLAVALVSLFLNRAVRSDVAMTGELTLRGLVLPVGGVKDKLIAAHSAGVKRVFVPLRNLRDVEAEVPRVVKEEMEIVGVQRIEEVLAGAFDPPVVLRNAATAHL